MRWTLAALGVAVACHPDPTTPTGDDDDDVTVPTGDTAPTPTDTAPPEHTGTAPAHSTPPAHTGDSGGGPPETTADTGPFAWPPDPVADVVVDCNGGADFRTIQAAIDGSVSGTHIGVRPCRYTERIDFRGKSLDIFGIDGSSATTLSGGGSGPVVQAVRGESDGTRLAGFTVTGGSGNGAAIEVSFATLQLEDVILANNGRGSGSVLEADAARVTWAGGGATQNDVGRLGDVVDASGGILAMDGVAVSCDGANSAVTSHNVALVTDSAIACDGNYGWFVERGEIRARRTRFDGGRFGLYAEDADDNRSENAVLINSAMVGDEVGAHVRYMDLDAENCVFLGQEVGLEFLDGRVDSHVHDSVMWGQDCGLRGDPVVVSDVDWNLFDGPASCNAHGSHTLVGDPMFVSAPDDLHPAYGSPLIDAGDPSSDADDPDGSRNDLGIYGGPDSVPR